MRTITISLALLLTVFNAHSEELELAKSALASAASVITVPVMANTPGIGGLFKTKVVIINPTLFSYPIGVSLYDTTGQIKNTTINMSAGQIRNYDNFLEDVFSHTGAGTVNFDSLAVSGGSFNFKFLVSAEVYTDSDKGRFKTVVISGAPLDSISPDTDAYSIGINVDSNTRTNIGCFNTSFSTNVIDADLYDSSNKLVTTITLNLGGASWTQVAVPNSVSGGYIKWRPISGAYCYAVVVDNKSNDGTFLPAINYVP